MGKIMYKGQEFQGKIERSGGVEPEPYDLTKPFPEIEWDLRKSIFDPVHNLPLKCSSNITFDEDGAHWPSLGNAYIMIVLYPICYTREWSGKLNGITCEIEFGEFHPDDIAGSAGYYRTFMYTKNANPSYSTDADRGILWRKNSTEVNNGWQVYNGSWVTPPLIEPGENRENIYIFENKTVKLEFLSGNDSANFYIENVLQGNFSLGSSLKSGYDQYLMIGNISYSAFKKCNVKRIKLTYTEPET